MSKIKIVMFGLGAVGKSAITLRYTGKFFQSYYDPTIEDTFRTTVNVGEQLLSLEITDTAGQEGYDGLKDTYIRSSDGFFIVYSIIEEKTLAEVTNIRNRIYRVLDREKDEHIPICLVGNKCDLEKEREVKKEVGEELARTWNALFFETSAKTNVNVSQAYQALASDIVETEKKKKQINGSSTEQPTGRKKCSLL